MIQRERTGLQSFVCRLLGLASFLALWATATAAEPAAPGWQRLSVDAAPLFRELGRPPAEKGDALDPVGDSLTPAVDLTGLSVQSEDNVLSIEVLFDGVVSPSDSGASNAARGFIDIDADQNGLTGNVPFADLLGGDSGLGNEFYVDLFDGYSSSDGLVDVFDDITGLVIGRVSAEFTARSLRVEIPLTLLADDGTVNVAAVFGNSDGPGDVVPDVGSVSTGPSSSLLLNNDRFRVSIQWRSPPQFPDFTSATAADFRTDDSGIFYFTQPNNLEFLIKVLNGCAITNHYWVFFAATTDVEFLVSVTDTSTGETVQYTNPAGQPADAVTDTTAFANCP